MIKKKQYLMVQYNIHSCISTCMTTIQNIDNLERTFTCMDLKKMHSTHSWISKHGFVQKIDKTVNFTIY